LRSSLWPTATYAADLDESVSLAVLGAHDDAGVNSVLGRMDVDLGAVDPDLAGGARIEAENGANNLGAPRAHEPQEPDDLGYVRLTPDPKKQPS
jgi:hypothetical protein